MGDDVAAWLLSYGAVSEAVIATVTLPLPRSTPPRRAGEGAPGWWTPQRRYGPRGRCGAGAAAPHVGYGSDRRGAGRAAPRLRRNMRCGPGGASAGRGRSRKVREVELVLLHRGRAMDFAVGLLPFQDGIAAAGTVGGRGGGRCNGLGVDAAGPPREAAGGRARSVWGHRWIFFLACQCMVPALCEDARGAWETAASGTLQHGLWGFRVGRTSAIQASAMALLGAAAGEGVDWVVWSQSQGRRRSVDLTTVWLN